MDNWVEVEAEKNPVEQRHQIKSTVKLMRNIAGVLFVITYVCKVLDQFIDFVLITNHFEAFLQHLFPLLAFILLFFCSSNKNVKIGTLLLIIAWIFDILVQGCRLANDFYNVKLSDSIIYQISNFSSKYLFIFFIIWGYGILYSNIKYRSYKNWFVILISIHLIIRTSPFIFNLDSIELQNFLYIWALRIVPAHFIFYFFYIFVYWKLSQSELYEGKREELEDNVNLLPNSRYLISIGVTVLLLVLAIYLLNNYYTIEI